MMKKGKYIISQDTMIIITLAIIIAMSVYVNYYKGLDVVYTHLFYPVILLVGIWLKKYVIPISLFMGFFHIALNYLSNDVLLINSILRAAIFFIVALVISKLNIRIEDFQGMLDRLLNSIEDGVIAIDSEKKVINMNKAAEKITGWSIEESKGKEIFDICDVTFEGNRKKPKKFVDEIMEMEDLFESPCQEIIIGKDDEKKMIEFTVISLNDIEGDISGDLLVIRDISEKDCEKRKMEFLTFKDYLTGVYNKKYLEEVLLGLDYKKYLPVSIVMGDLNNLKLINDTYGHIVGDEVLRSVAQVMQKICKNDEIIVRWGGDEFVILLPNSDEANTKCMVSKISKAVNNIEIIKGFTSMTFGWAVRKSMDENFKKTMEIAEENMYKKKRNEKLSVRGEPVNTMMEILLEKSEVEKNHSTRVSLYCRQLAEEMDLSISEIDLAAISGLVHDIGKTIIDKDILDKKEELIEAEWIELKRHPEIGYRIISGIKNMTDIAVNVLAHHEKWDGTGYPNQLAGEDIPKIARIIAIAEAYDAMVSECNYKEPFTKEEAINEIISCAGTAFDPEIAKVFIEKVLKDDNDIMESKVV